MKSRKIFVSDDVKILFFVTVIKELTFFIQIFREGKNVSFKFTLDNNRLLYCYKTS